MRWPARANSCASRCTMRRGWGRGPARSGQRRVRLDVGAGPRLNQVTVTGTNYERSVEFYRRLGLRQIVDSPDTGYARFETAGGVDLLGPDRSRGEDHRDDRDLSRMRRSRRAGRAARPQRNRVRARPAQPAVDVARGAAARPRRQHHLPLQGGRRRAASRRGGWKPSSSSIGSPRKRRSSGKRKAGFQLSLE